MFRTQLLIGVSSAAQMRVATKTEIVKTEKTFSTIFLDKGFEEIIRNGNTKRGTLFLKSHAAYSQFAVCRSPRRCKPNIDVNINAGLLAIKRFIPIPN